MNEPSSGRAPGIRIDPVPLIAVTVRDTSRDLVGTAPHTRAVLINAGCPACAVDGVVTPRGPREGRYKWHGASYWVQEWANPCGHVDRDDRVILEATLIATVQGPGSWTRDVAPGTAALAPLQLSREHLADLVIALDKVDGARPIAGIAAARSVTTRHVVLAGPGDTEFTYEWAPNGKERTRGLVNQLPGTEEWRPLFEKPAALDHDDLIDQVCDLATQVRDGHPGLVDDLVAHCRVLYYRFMHRGFGYPRHWARPTRLAELPVSGLAARTRSDTMVMTANLVQDDHIGSQFVATTAGHVRTVFTRGGTPISRWLGGLSLDTVPAELPVEDETPVMLFGTLQGGPSTLLLKIGLGEDPAVTVARIRRRIVDHEPFPWEAGGWAGD